MSTKTMDVWQCDNPKCGNIHVYGALPDGWVWGMVAMTKKKANPMKHGEVVDVPYRDEVAFCSEACAKTYSKDMGRAIERPKVPNATA